jgi:hypothetical protein
MTQLPNPALERATRFVELLTEQQRIDIGRSALYARRGHFFPSHWKPYRDLLEAVGLDPTDSNDATAIYLAAVIE